MMGIPFIMMMVTEYYEACQYRQPCLDCGRLFNPQMLIGDNIVVASNTVVYKSFFNSNILIGGQPVKVLKENIQWRI